MFYYDTKLWCNCERALAIVSEVCSNYAAFIQTPRSQSSQFLSRDFAHTDKQWAHS